MKLREIQKYPSTQHGTAYLRAFMTAHDGPTRHSRATKPSRKVVMTMELAGAKSPDHNFRWGHWQIGPWDTLNGLASGFHFSTTKTNGKDIMLFWLIFEPSPKDH